MTDHRSTADGPLRPPRAIAAETTRWQPAQRSASLSVHRVTGRCRPMPAPVRRVAGLGALCAVLTALISATLQALARRSPVIAGVAADCRLTLGRRLRQASSYCACTVKVAAGVGGAPGSRTTNRLRRAPAASPTGGQPRSDPTWRGTMAATRLATHASAASASKLSPAHATGREDRELQCALSDGCQDSWQVHQRRSRRHSPRPCTGRAGMSNTQTSRRAQHGERGDLPRLGERSAGRPIWIVGAVSASRIWSTVPPVLAAARRRPLDDPSRARIPGEVLPGAAPTACSGGGLPGGRTVSVLHPGGPGRDLAPGEKRRREDRTSRAARATSSYPDAAPARVLASHAWFFVALSRCALSRAEQEGSHVRRTNLSPRSGDRSCGLGRQRVLSDRAAGDCLYPGLGPVPGPQFRAGDVRSPGRRDADCPVRAPSPCRIRRAVRH
jgi:hypothetical protein